MRAFRAGSRGFTLIELLIVVAIVGVLAAVLLPAAQNALWTARVMRASSNMRQIATAVNAYSADNDGRLPGPFVVGSYIYARKYPLPNDFPHLGNYLGQYLGAPDPAASVATSSLVVPALQCPLLSGTAQHSVTTANYITWDYSYNNPNCRFGGGGSTVPLSMSAAQTAPVPPARQASLTPVARNTPFLSTADRQIWASTQNGALPATGADKGKRLWLFLDGTVQINDKTALWTR